MSDRRGELLQMIDNAEAGFNRSVAAFEELSTCYFGGLPEELKSNLVERRKSSLEVPLVYAKVRRIVAAMQEAYFTNDAFAKISIDDDELRLEESLQSAVDHYTTQRVKLFSVLSPVFDRGVVYGTMMVKSYWGADGLVVQGCDIDEVLVDPNARSAADIRYLVHNIHLTKGEIERYRKAGFFKLKRSEIDTFVEDVDIESDDTEHGRIALQEVYSRDEKSRWVVSTVYDKSVFLRQDMPLADGLPFTIGTMVPQMIAPNERNAVRVYGESPIRAMVSLHREMSIRRNQQIDAIDLQLNPRYLVNTTAGLDLAAFHSQDKVIRVGGALNAIQQVPTPNIQPSVFDVERLDVEAQEAIGVTAYNSGVEGNGLNSTATGISILSQEANTRIQSLIRSCNETFMEPLFQRIAELVLKYGENKFFAGVPRHGRIRVSVDTGLGATNKDIQIRNASQVLDRMMMFSQADPNMMQTAKRFFFKEIVPLLGIKNTEEYFDDNEGISQLGGMAGAQGAFSGAGAAGLPGGALNGLGGGAAFTDGAVQGVPMATGVTGADIQSQGGIA